ncbi:MAG: hypothetical protein GY803_22815 [Chloroflexi bacterium]|nr:hypothetical protein [Chloroflexota bacterium]
MVGKVLLLNGGMDGEFRPFRGDKGLVTAVSWAPWQLKPEAGGPSWKNKQPAFSAYTLDDQRVQQISAPFGTFVGGLWQQVPAAAGNQYTFSAEGQAWSSEDAAPASQLEASDVNLQIGVDPTGGADPDSPLIIWSDKFQPLSHWETLSLTAVAESAVLTVFLKSAPILPKRQQSVFWRNAFLRPIGRHKRSMNITGAGDTHIALEPERPQPGNAITATVSSNRAHEFVGLRVEQPNGAETAVQFQTQEQVDDRIIWKYEFTPELDGLYDIRFVGDEGARLLALRLLRVSRDVQLVPSDAARLHYKRVYVLLPPTSDVKWALAAARGSFDGRYTIGFSADDAGIGDLDSRHVLAVNPHHWPDVLTASWFRQHYPGVEFTAVVANTPADLEAWLKGWTPEE